MIDRLTERDSAEMQDGKLSGPAIQVNVDGCLEILRSPYNDDILEAVTSVGGRVHPLDSVSVCAAGVTGQDCQEPAHSRYQLYISSLSLQQDISKLIGRVPRLLFSH